MQVAHVRVANLGVSGPIEVRRGAVQTTERKVPKDQGPMALDRAVAPPAVVVDGVAVAAPKRMKPVLRQTAAEMEPAKVAGMLKEHAPHGERRQARRSQWPTG